MYRLRSKSLSLLLLWFCSAANNSAALESVDYLKSRLKETTTDWLLNYGNTAAVSEDDSNKGMWENLWSNNRLAAMSTGGRTSSQQQQPRAAVNLFDEMFMIDGAASARLNLDEANNTSGEADDQLNLIASAPNQAIKFIKGYFWNTSGTSFFIVCQMNYCTHYQGVNAADATTPPTLNNQQLIKYPGLIPIDAVFFSGADKPHLVIAYDFNDYSTAKIYQWNGTHMVLVDETLLLASPKSVTTFQSGANSTIVLFIDDAGAPAHCVIYEFDDQSSIRRTTSSPWNTAADAIYPYSYAGRQYFLIVRDDRPAEIFRWNDAVGLEKLRATLPEIPPFADQMRLVQVDSQTALLFTSDLHAIRVYKVEGEKVRHLSDLALANNEQRLVELTAWKYENTIMLLLVKLNQAEVWQLKLHDVESWSADEENHADFSRACLRELKGVLARNAEQLLTIPSGQSRGASVAIGDLTMNDGNITVVEFRIKENRTTSCPWRTKEKLSALRDNAMLAKSDMRTSKARVLGDMRVDADAYFEELRVDELQAERINGEPADFDNYLVSGVDQQFRTAVLGVKEVSIDELHVSSLCGYGFDHWMQVNDSARSSIGQLTASKNGSWTINDDTIVIESSRGDESIMTLKELNARSINGVALSDFLENVFIVGKSEQSTIAGNVRYEALVQVTGRLYGDRVNNVSSSDLITKPSNQSLMDVFIDRLEVDRLEVEKINGVSINQAARMSKENVIKGKVTLGKLVVTNELSVKGELERMFLVPSQLYEQTVQIDGQVFVRNLELEKADVRGLVDNSWSRSSAQVIQAPMGLRRGASIDQLQCLHLNGLREQDFLYSDSTELSDLENLTFADFQFDQAGFLDPVERKDQLTFRRSVRLRYLSLDNLLATDGKYNGIPLESIMRANDFEHSSHSIAGAEFENVRVDGPAGMSVDELRVITIEPLPLLTDQSLTLDSFSLPMSFTHLNVSKLNGRDLDGALAAVDISRASALTIDAQVRIEGAAGMRVDRINDEEASDYISGHLRDLTMEIKAAADLTVVENLEVGSLNGDPIDADFFASLLSKTRRQTLTGLVAVDDARMHYLTATAMNDVDLAKLLYVDRLPELLHVGNLSFFDLYVDGNVTSRTFNSLTDNKLETRLQAPAAAGKKLNLLVQADVRWDSSRPLRSSLTRLLGDAVTKHQHQVIRSDTTFEGPLVVDSLYLPSAAGIFSKITDVISDTAVDNVASSLPITVKATKIFKRPLILGSARVDGDIAVERVNGLDLRQISRQIFQKDRANQAITADLTFLDRVQVSRLRVARNIHGVPLQQLALVGQRIMPKTLHFQHLLVDGQVSLRKLDGLNFDDFIERRTTVDQDHEIVVDAQFVNSLRVLNASFVASVNQVAPGNLVQNNADVIPTVLHGNKIFRSKLIVERNLETELVNHFQVDAIYDNAVLKGANDNILGSVVFEDEVEINGNVTVSGETNGLQLLQRAGEIKCLPAHKSKQNTLISATSLLVSSLNDIDNETNVALDATVFYLEEQKKFNWHFAAVQSIKSPVRKDKTRVEIVTTEIHKACGLLQSDCWCRKQYIVDILPSGEYEIREQNVNNVTNTFYPPEGAYGLKIVSTSASYSEQCSKTIDERQQSKVFWLKFYENKEILRRKPALLIDGFISDAQTFQLGDQLYLIVAIFYNEETKSHATDSLLYQFDSTNGKTFLIQRIPTDGAKSIEVFEIPNVGLHILIGCVKGRAESLLLRFNPITRQMIRTFATGGSKYIASVKSNEQSFLILNNPDVKALQIFNYNHIFDNFADYQILFFESRITSLGVFYSGDFGYSDAFVVTTTKDGWLYMYEYMFYGKFQLRMSFWADDIQVLTPFRHMGKNYLFAGFKFNSTVYKVIQQTYY